MCLMILLFVPHDSTINEEPELVHVHECITVVPHTVHQSMQIDIYTTYMQFIMKYIAIGHCNT